MRLIGRRCKCGNAFSWPILIGRGLDLITMRSKLFNMDRIFLQKRNDYDFTSRETSLETNKVKVAFRKSFLGYAVVSLPREDKQQEIFISIYSAWKSVIYTIVVIIAERSHLFPFRTQKLSSPAPKVLVGSLTGRIGRRHFLLPLSSVG